jgi:hypothetical protein
VPRLIYGIFPNRELAEAAKNTLQEQALKIEHEGEVATAELHEHEVSPDNLPTSATIARRAALVGGVLVGACVGVFLTLLTSGVFLVGGGGGPSTIAGASPTGIVLISLAAAAFGAVLTSIAGTAGNRAKIRWLEREVEKGRVLLTIEAPRDRVRAITRVMMNDGALRIGSIRSTGTIGSI